MKNIGNYLKGILTKLNRRLVSFLYKNYKTTKLPFKSHRLLFVRLDGIGDYVLFRNFIQGLKQNQNWKSYKITLLGNPEFKEIAETVDQAFVDEFIWIHPNNLYSDHLFQSLSLKLKLKSFDVIISPVHSRLPIVDQLVFSSGGKFLIGCSGDYTNYSDESSKHLSDQSYNQLIPSLSIYHFEFLRNLHFFNALFRKEGLTKLSLPFGQSIYLDPTAFNVVIFPGAGRPYRQWAPEKFAEVINLLDHAKNFEKMKFYIAGSKLDTGLASRIIAACKGSVTDLTGKTTLKELVDLIGNSNFLISNETSAVHIAAGTSTPAVCISNGNHFGRFSPYPAGISDKIITIYPCESFYTTNEELRNKLIEKYSAKSDVDINLIEPLKVYQATCQLMQTFSMKWNHIAKYSAR